MSAKLKPVKTGTDTLACTQSTSKYLNKKTKVDGITFDSKKEANRYLILKQMEKEGKINSLKRQVPFPLIRKSKYGREIRYIADFTYYLDGWLVVEDVKSPYTRKNPVYKLKKRLMAELYGIVINEV